MQAAQPSLNPIASPIVASDARRLIGLAIVFAIAAALLVAVDRQPEAQAARWPSEPSLYAIAGWAVGQPTVEAQNGNQYITVNYARPGARASASITTSTEAKRVYRAGAAIPFLGNGYTVDQLPPSLVIPRDDRSVLLVRREGDVGVLVYAYGERRGLVGNGVTGWGLVALDALLDRPNDYYLLRVYVPLTSVDAGSVGSATALADELFDRVVAFYTAG